MIKFKSGRLVIITISAVLLVFMLYGISREKNDEENGFVRLLGSKEIRLLKRVHLQSRRFYIAGFVKNRLYLGKTTAPLQLVTLDNDGTEVHRIRAKNVQIAQSKITIDSPWFYVADIQRYNIYRGALANWKIDTVLAP